MKEHNNIISRHTDIKTDIQLYCNININLLKHKRIRGCVNHEISGVRVFDMFPNVLQGLTFFLTYTILASMLGMLQFGYNTGVINAPEVVSTVDPRTSSRFSAFPHKYLLVFP